jgi:hypothetical protein
MLVREALYGGGGAQKDPGCSGSQRDARCQTPVCILGFAHALRGVMHLALARFGMRMTTELVF